MSNEEEILKHKRRVRGGIKGSVKNLISSVDEVPHSPELRPKIQATINTLKKKEQVLEKINDEILASTKQENIDEEIATADEFATFIGSAILEFEQLLISINNSTISPESKVNDIVRDIEVLENSISHDASPVLNTEGANDAETDEPRNTNMVSPQRRSHVKLPELSMVEFHGKLENWTTFWDSFESTVHNHPHLPDIDKFKYLLSSIKGEAAHTIGGLSITSDNYRKAVEKLKRKYGNKQKIIDQHMEALLALEVSGKGLRYIYDTIESHVSSLISLNVPSQNYGSLLTSVILKKLPNDIRLTISRELKDDDWDFDKFLELLHQEVEARERASIKPPKYDKPPLTNYNPKFSKPVSQNSSYMKNIGTATTLFTPSNTPSYGPTCTYCHSSHASNSCKIVTSVQARKEILRRSKRCYICLRKEHFNRSCDGKNCQKCGQRHHISICSQLHPDFNNRSENPRYANYSQDFRYQVPQSQTSNYYQPMPQPGYTPRNDYYNEPARSQDANPSYKFPNNGQHRYPPTQQQHPSQSRGNNPYQSTNPAQNSLTMLYFESTTPVLLQTAQCHAFHPDSYFRRTVIRLLLDSGSQRTYITMKLRNYLGLPTIAKRDIIIKTFGSSKETKQTVDVVYMSIQSPHGDIQLSAFVVPFICEPLTCQPLNQAKQYFPQLPNISFADSCSPESNVEIDLLIGSDQYWSVVTGGIIRGESGLSAICTKLGWVLSGPLHTSDVSIEENTNFITTHVLKCDTQLEASISSNQSELETSLHKFWDLESLGIKPRSVYEDLSESIMFKDGRYQVHLPWKTPHPLLPDNYLTCFKRYESLMRRLNKEPEILKEYDKTIKDQLKNGILEVVEDSNIGEVGRTHYLAHHCVIREDKETTKLRIVFDGSNRNPGPSLNDCLLVGPPLTHHLLDILLRFRVNRIGLTGDIEKAFLMVSIAEEDRDVLRFIWTKDIHDPNSPFHILRFTRVTFGVSSSPFLLNATIKYHMEQFLEDDPDFVKKFMDSIYVDDLSSGANTVDNAYEFYKKSKDRLTMAGFNLRKFVSNSSELMDRINTNESLSDDLKPQETVIHDNHIISDEDSYTKIYFGSSDFNSEQRILGVRWNYILDLFVFDLQEIADLAKNCVPTKRNIVSLASKIFDPFGYLSPVTIQFKMLFQELCKCNYDWDNELKGDNLDHWTTLVESLQTKTTYFLPRCLFYGVSEAVISISLHGFCDSSMKAYGAVIYLRIETTTNCYIRFLVSKTRVSPITQHTIPRLELLSALVLARLMESVVKALSDQLDIQKLYCWTDSKVSLYWIKSIHREYKQFVQNRVSEIRNLTPIDIWGHCSGKSNPADILSRGISPLDLLTNTLWQNGPSWLSQFTDTTGSGTDKPDIIPNECIQEMKIQERDRVTTSLMITDSLNTHISQIINCEDFSDYNRLIRVTSYVLRYINNLKAKSRETRNLVTHLTPDELNKSENLWLKDNQSGLIVNSKFNQWKHEFDFFTSHDDGLIKCQGRLQNAEISDSSKNPIILNSQHHVTLLIVKECHNRVMHGGVKSTLTQLRSKFWIIRGRQFVRKIIFQCVTCRKFDAKPYQVLAPPPLPSFRVNESTPFSHTGVDFAGPLYVKTQTQELQKVWIALFTCCSTRAVHLQLLPDLTTESFLRCFKRFAARYGTPNEVISDNAKTFISASEQLQKFTDDPVIKNHFSQERIKWSFNLEKAPWWGGIFERLIKSTKRCLRKFVGNAKLSFDELLTVIVEIETILNCRPLSYVSTEDWEEPLTPSHLLYGRRILGLPSETKDLTKDFNPVKPNEMRRRLNHLSMILSHFWSRWKGEYLLELRNSHRSHSSNTSNIISEGDIVIVNDENQPRSLWKLGKVEKLVTGDDGLSRGAIVKVSTNGKSFNLRRPIQLLYPLEVSHKTETDNPVFIDIVSQEAKTIETETIRPRRKAAVSADIKRKGWITQLTQDNEDIS